MAEIKIKTREEIEEELNKPKELSDKERIVILEDTILFLLGGDL